jgi:hypothetical protein
VSASAAEPEPAQRRIRRILVAFDWGSEHAGAVETVAALAARLRAELKAMFVEDIDLLRLAEHPHVFAFSTLSASGEQLAADHLRRVLRARLARSRQAIEEAAARRQIRCAFEVRQGRLLVEALDAAGDEDLVIVSWQAGHGGPSWVTSRPPPVVIARALAEARARSVLLLHPEAPDDGPVLVAFDGSEAARAALAAASEIADRDGGLIEIALLTGRAEQASAWAGEIAGALAESALRARFVHLPRVGLDDVCPLAIRQHGSLLVVPADLALADAGGRALERVPCSVLLVR